MAPWLSRWKTKLTCCVTNIGLLFPDLTGTVPAHMAKLVRPAPHEFAFSRVPNSIPSALKGWEGWLVEPWQEQLTLPKSRVSLASE